ncbi:MAG: hypothetical protein ACFCD0_15915 [Gemmataceae bacterium]
MTVAVCLQCGEFKHGAFNPCRKCGYVPDDDESLTKHLLVTDHFHTREALEAIAARVKAGQSVTFAPETLKAGWVSKAELDAGTTRIGRGCLIVLGVVFVLVVMVTAALLVWPDE